MNRPAALAEIDDALTDCARRLRNAKNHHDAEARLVYQRQLDRLLDWRLALLNPRLIRCD